jgi:predicted DNA-binding transcriptional regulator AlpA
MSQSSREEREAVELLPPADAARLLGLAQSSFFALVAEGALPRPIKIGRRARWARKELENWIQEQHERAQTVPHPRRTGPARHK